jgi:hypothetical protein
LCVAACAGFSFSFIGVVREQRGAGSPTNEMNLSNRTFIDFMFNERGNYFHKRAYKG